MSLFRRFVIGMLVLLVTALVLGYQYLRASGLISRHDYDTQAPLLPGFSKPAILIFNKTNGFIHHDALPAADALLVRLAGQQGWDVFVTDNGAVHNKRDLERFQLIVWNNVSGDVLTQDQRESFRHWIEQGGGWLGIHASGGDIRYEWNWYVETLIGAQFVGHTVEPQFQDAKVLVSDTAEWLTDHLASPWIVPQEEWYAFDNNPREKGYKILLAVDESSYITQGKTFMWNDRMEGEHPIVWRHKVGEGKVFYSSMGHTPESYDIPEYQELIEKAMSWAIKR